MPRAFHEVVEEISHYDLESKIMIKDLCEQMIRKERRVDFVRDIEEGMQEYREGKMKVFRNIKDLRTDLDAD